MAVEARMMKRAARWAAVAVLLLFGSVHPAAAQAGRPLRIVVLGDSLSAGFLLPPEEAFPAVLEASLRQRGYDVAVTNAAVVNDTSWDGLARLDRDVPAGTDGVIVELGANDRLMLVDPEVTRGVLDQIVARLKARGIPVLLTGFRMPIAWGGDETRFDAVFRWVAARHRVTLYPDIYAGLWSDRRYRSLDGVHPSSDGVRRIVSGILPTVTRFVSGLPGRTRLRS